jgi:hypothetical protein
MLPQGHRFSKTESTLPVFEPHLDDDKNDQFLALDSSNFLSTQQWSCKACTYGNYITMTYCEMCGTPNQNTVELSPDKPSYASVAVSPTSVISLSQPEVKQSKEMFPGCKGGGSLNENVA